MISFFVTLGRFLRAIYVGLKEPEFRNLLFFVLILLLSGSIFYSQTEHWSFLDALYFSVTTLTTIGNEMELHTNLAKIFTIVYIFAGLGSMAGLVAALARHAQEQHPNLDKISERITGKK